MNVFFFFSVHTPGLEFFKCEKLPLETRSMKSGLRACCSKILKTGTLLTPLTVLHLPDDLLFIITGVVVSDIKKVVVYYVGL